MLKAKNKAKYIFSGLIILALWWIFYSNILAASKWLTYDLFSIGPRTKLGDAIEFFIYDTVKIYLLLILMVYAIGWIRASISVEKVRDFLVGKKRIAGYFLGSSFGAITPFCSCSSIPLFLGFTSARIPLGITMAFLITSPLINEIAVVILWGLLGWKFTMVYIVVGMLAGIIGGAIIDAFKAEKWLKAFILEKLAAPETAIQNNQAGATKIKLSWEQRHDFALSETKDIFKRVWLWVIIGVGVGAGLHGFVPQDWITSRLGDGQWWSVPVAVTIGIPLYTNVTGIIPVMETLLAKGLPVGTTLALCMSTIAISLPEILMLKQVMRWQLLLLFISMMLVIFTLVGWLFNAVGSFVLFG